MRVISAVLLIFCSGCAPVSQRPDSDYLAVARLALAEIDRKDTPIFVAAPGIAKQAQSAFAELGRMPLASSAAPAAADGGLPSGYIWLAKFDLIGERAHVETATALKCGVGTGVNLSRLNGAWKVTGVTVSICTSH